MAGHACDGHIHEKDSLFPVIGFRNISVTDNGRTVSIMNTLRSFQWNYLIGNVTYEEGEHDIYVILERIPSLCRGWIGMTCNFTTTRSVLGNGVLVWSISSTKHVRSGNICDVDLGQPWQSGDKLHLHLDVDLQSLCIVHMRTKKTHTICYIVRCQRLFMPVKTDNEAKITIS